VVDTLLDQPGYQVFHLYMWDRPAGDRDFPLVYMTIAFEDQIGAAHFYDHYADQTRDAAAVTTGTEDGPGAVELLFRPEAGIAYPRDALVTRAELRRIALEFVRTGNRPTSVTWQSVEFV
jgi:hypothetical protein